MNKPARASTRGVHRKKCDYERKPMQRAIRPYSNVDAALTHINNHNSATMPK